MTQEPKSRVEIISERKTKIGQVDVTFTVGRIHPKPKYETGNKLHPREEDDENNEEGA